MTPCLVLNSTYEPISVVDWKKAICLWFQGKVEVMAEHEQDVRSVTITMKVPAVIRLLEFVRMRKRTVVPFSRANVLARDEYRCQFCAVVFPTLKLTIDHVLPVAQGGPTSYENTVTACEPCNKRKGNRTPEQAQMPLLGTPRRPVVGHHGPVATHTAWVPYLWKHAKV